MKVASALLLFAAALSCVYGQAPNNVYPGRESLMTSTYNSTVFLLPIPKSVAQSIVGSYSILTPPAGLLPNGFLTDTQTLLYLTAGYQYDIRMSGLQVPELSIFNAYIPFVDVLGNGVTPFMYNYLTYDDLLIPALVGTISTLSNIQVANFDPPHAAYKSVANDLALTVSQNLLTGLPGVGVGISYPRFQFSIRRTTTHPISATAYQTIVNQPYLKAITTLGPKCERGFLWYNQTYTQAFFGTGQVQVYSPVLPTTTIFNNAQAYVGTSAWISPPGPGQACSNFA